MCCWNHWLSPLQRLLQESNQMFGFYLRLGHLVLPNTSQIQRWKMLDPPGSRGRLLMPFPNAKVSPAKVLRTTLLILFDCQHIGENLPICPISMIRCPPWVPPSGRFPMDESLNTIGFRELSFPKYQNLKVTSSDFSSLISLFAQCRVLTAACFVLVARMDLSISYSVSVRGASCCVALVGSTWMVWRFFMYIHCCSCISSSTESASIPV